MEFIADVVGSALGELEKRRMRYCGVWRRGTQYDEGALCTHKGSMWHCSQLTKAEPGKGSSAWTLCVKRGRDGKDAG
jgi:hypothetical protein